MAEANKMIHFGIASDAQVAEGKYNYIHWTPPSSEAEKWVEEAQKRGHETVGVLYWYQQGSMAIVDALKEEIRTSDMIIVGEEQFSGTDDTDFRTQITKLQQTNPDIYFIMAMSSSSR